MNDLSKLEGKQLTQSDMQLIIDYTMIPVIIERDPITNEKIGSKKDNKFKKTVAYRKMVEQLMQIESTDITFDKKRSCFVAEKNGSTYTIPIVREFPCITIETPLTNGFRTTEYEVVDKKSLSWGEEAEEYFESRYWPAQIFLAEASGRNYYGKSDYDIKEYTNTTISTNEHSVSFDKNGNCIELSIDDGQLTIAYNTQYGYTDIDYAGSHSAYTNDTLYKLEQKLGLLHEIEMNGTLEQKQLLGEFFEIVPKDNIRRHINCRKISRAEDIAADLIDIDKARYISEAKFDNINVGLQAMHDLYFSTPQGVEMFKRRMERNGIYFPFYIPDSVRAEGKLNIELLNELEGKCNQVIKGMLHPLYQGTPELSGNESKSDIIKIMEQGNKKLMLEAWLERKDQGERIELLRELDSLDIRGKKLYNLLELTWEDPKLLRATVDMLKSGVWSSEEIHSNLSSRKPRDFFADQDDPCFRWLDALNKMNENQKYGVYMRNRYAFLVERT